MSHSWRRSLKLSSPMTRTVHLLLQQSVVNLMPGHQDVNAKLFHTVQSKQRQFHLFCLQPSCDLRPKHFGRLVTCIVQVTFPAKQNLARRCRRQGVAGQDFHHLPATCAFWGWARLRVRSTKRFAELRKAAVPRVSHISH